MGKALETDQVKVDAQVQIAHLNADKDLALLVMKF